MLCLKVARILPTVLALSLLRPNPIPIYNASDIIPLTNKVCLPLSEKREELFKNQLYGYLCYCIETNIETDKFVEHFTHILNWFRVNKQYPTGKMFAETFTNISKYLEAEFNKQDKTIRFLDGETKENYVSNDSEISNFVVQNINLPVDQFYPKYSTFLMNHLLDKFKRDFEKLKVYSIPRLFKIELDFINCDHRHLYDDGDFQTISDVVRSMNASFSKLVEVLIEYSF